MTLLAPHPARPEVQAICRDQLYHLLLEGAGLNEWRIEALLDRVGGTPDPAASLPHRDRARTGVRP